MEAVYYSIYRIRFAYFEYTPLISKIFLSFENYNNENLRQIELDQVILIIAKEEKDHILQISFSMIIKSCMLTTFFNLDSDWKSIYYKFSLDQNDFLDILDSYRLSLSWSMIQNRSNFYFSWDSSYSRAQFDFYNCSIIFDSFVNFCIMSWLLIETSYFFMKSAKIYF